jgi:hypothetical protein
VVAEVVDVVALLGAVIVELLCDDCEDDIDVDEDVDVGERLAEGKERDVLLLGTLQNSCASSSAVVSSPGHPLEMQSTISLVKRLLGS